MDKPGCELYEAMFFPVEFKGPVTLPFLSIVHIGFFSWCLYFSSRLSIKPFPIKIPILQPRTFSPVLVKYNIPFLCLQTKSLPSIPIANYSYAVFFSFFNPLLWSRRNNGNPNLPQRWDFCLWFNIHGDIVASCFLQHDFPPNMD